MVDFGEDVDFVVSKFTEFGSVFELFCAHHFDGVEASYFFVFGPVDAPVLPFPNALHQNVLLYNFTYHLSLNIINLNSQIFSVFLCKFNINNLQKKIWQPPYDSNLSEYV